MAKNKRITFDSIASAILKELTESIAKDAQEHCPMDTGALRESMRVKVTGVSKGSGSNTTVGQGYADGSVDLTIPKNATAIEISYETPYAVFVHEMQGDVNWTTPGTGAKWLENAVKNSINNLEGKYGGDEND